MNEKMLNCIIKLWRHFVHHYISFILIFRYESVIIPREEGKILESNPKKQKKTKGVYKMPQVSVTFELIFVTYMSLRYF